MGENYQKLFEEYIEREKHLGLMVMERVKKYGSRPGFHHKSYGEWEAYTWESFGEQATAVAKGLLKLGIKQKETTGIFSLNRPEWHIADIGSLLIGAIDVPVYATDSADEAEYIVNDAEIKIMFVGAQDQYDRIMKILDASKYLEYVIVFDRTVKIDNSRKNVMLFDDFLELGRNADTETELEARKGHLHYDDVATIIYTSGTTGEPKGVVLTHKNLLHEQWAVRYYVVPEAGEHDNSLCFLPLSHVFERSYCYGVFAIGATMYYCYDPAQIVDFMVEARPTFMNSVPRLYEKVYSTVYGKIDTVSGLKQKLFHWAVAVGKETFPYRQNIRELGKGMPLGLRFRYFLAKALILNKIRNAFSEKPYAFTAGGAALNSQIAEFFYNAGVPVFTGYGLTETAPVVTANRLDKFDFTSAGSPIPLVDVRIDSETGEIQVKGPNVFTTYHKKPAATKEAFTEDGWFKTGDIGYFDEEGYIHITDRIKDLIITSGGKNIAPQKLETMLAEEYLIEFVVAIGEGRKFISALIVPSFEALEEYASSKKISFSSREDLIYKPEIIKVYQDIIDNRCMDLGQVEKIKKFTLLSNEFSTDTGEITPTMKIKRKNIDRLYQKEINDMYQE